MTATTNNGLTGVEYSSAQSEATVDVPGDVTVGIEVTEHKGNVLHEDITTVSVYVCIGIVGIIGNSFATFILLQSKSMRKKLVNIFLINQSILDLVSSIFLVSVGYNKNESIIVTFSGKKADLYCKLIGSRILFWSAITSSTWNLVFVNFERFLSVRFPIFHKTKIRRKHMIASISFVWLFGFLFNFAWTIVSSGYLEESSKCTTGGIWPNRLASLATGTANFAVQFFVPLLLMMSCYIQIIMTIRKRNVVSTSAATNGPNTEHQHKISRNILKTLSLLTIVFAVCWGPNGFIFLMYLYGVIKVLSTIYHISVYLVLLNCCLNPFLYAAQYKDFQAQIRKVFCKEKIPEGSSIQSVTM